MAIPDLRSDLRRAPGRAIRLARVGEAAVAADILAEAAEWTAQFGRPVWSPDEISEEKATEAALAGALVLGAEECIIVACMQLYDRDPVHWPRNEDQALYLHKIAVRRGASGRGWLEELVQWAHLQAKRRGARFLRLDTLPAGPLSELYSRLGFHVIDPEPLLLGGRLLFRMERPV
jgi:GNAT superfamily N-acetyltransferase